MKTKTMNTLGALVICVLLSACSRPKPETMSAQITEVNAIQPGSVNDFKISVGDSTYFQFDKSDLSADAKIILQKQADWLLKYPQYEVQIVGHCDARGTVAYNLGLGQRRANAVKSFLVHHGIPANRIKPFSLGKEHPVNTETTEEGYAANRVAISLLAQDGNLVERPASEMQAAGIIKQDGTVIDPQNLVSQ